MQPSRASKDAIYAKLGKWKYVSSKSLKGAFAETDYDKKEIRIDREGSQKDKKGDEFSKEDSTLINTIVHETLHKNHPRMHEKTVRKTAHNMVSRMSAKQKARYYNKLA